MVAPKTSPRLPRAGERRRAFGGRPGSSLWYGLILLVVMGLTQLYHIVPEGRPIPYSQFKTLVKNGAVEEITIGDQVIRDALKEPAADDPKHSKKFTTTRVDDAKLTEELEARSVKYSGEAVNRWLPELLGWILPLVFFVAIWGFFFRRMGGAEGGVMSFAKSRAKAYAEDEVKVRFADVAGVDEA